MIFKPPDMLNSASGLPVIAEFLCALPSVYEGRDPIFRGHANSAWSVRPSIFRPGGYGIYCELRLRHWISMASRFANPRPQNDFEWLVLAQHYRISTPLLDWTTNPLVALFFACQFTPENVDGCVVRFSSTLFQRYNKPGSIDVFKADREKPGIIDSSAMNARTLAQDSAMTIHTRDMPDLVPDERDLFVIPFEEKYRITQGLRELGFREERLYFDLGVVARQFNDERLIGYHGDAPR